METRPQGTAGANSQSRATARGWALPLLLAAAFAIGGVLLIAFRDDSPAGEPLDELLPSQAGEAWTPKPQLSSETVSLAIDFGDGARREFAALPWSRGMTVGDLMLRAAEFRPSLAYTQQGAGESAFLTSLEGEANDPDGGRYWLYSVNDKPAEVSFAVQPLAAGDRVLWKFSGPE